MRSSRPPWLLPPPGLSLSVSSSSSFSIGKYFGSQQGQANATQRLCVCVWLQAAVNLLVFPMNTENGGKEKSVSLYFFSLSPQPPLRLLVHFS